MKFKCSSISPEKATSTVLAIYYSYDSKTCAKTLSLLDKQLGGQLSDYIKEEIVSHKKGSFFRLSPLGNQSYKHIIFLGIGKTKNVTAPDIRHLSGSLSRFVKKLNASSVSIYLDTKCLGTIKEDQVTQSIAEGLSMGSYSFKGLKTKVESKSVALSETTLISSFKSASLKVGFSKGLAVAEGVNLARDLANTPANILTPTEVVKRAKAYFKGTTVKVSVIDAKQAAAMNMNAFLGVARGSVEAPYILCLDYKGGGTKKPIALVGKGVTFDSGGISIKPSSKMSEMKADMSGAASVFGAFSAISKIKPKDNIVGIMPLVENMPSSNALKPGDVITAMNKTSIEVLNTDAEGRLVLADSICYAISKLKARVVVDIATLTGASLVALGELAIALFSNSEKQIAEFKCNELFTGEKVWNMPLYDEFLDYLKSDVADISNCYEGRYGGVCTAAKFLQQFVGDTDWVHLDMAPLMSSSKTSGEQVKGMSGAATQSLIEFVT
ncbi:leucyl aminopeptidase [Candidatus Marinamargulisbacteria bacterium SCGC AAA071-K20]|nr:leucyl aminopeptidase [Candidatus Marinamargulisbacteria bacterium SCGC AAA071-K20]